jgi:hypothetical protein
LVRCWKQNNYRLLVDVGYRAALKWETCIAIFGCSMWLLVANEGVDLLWDDLCVEVEVLGVGGGLDLVEWVGCFFGDWRFWRWEFHVNDMVRCWKQKNYRLLVDVGYRVAVKWETCIAVFGCSMGLLAADEGADLVWDDLCFEVELLGVGGGFDLGEWVGCFFSYWGFCRCDFDVKNIGSGCPPSWFVI